MRSAIIFSTLASLAAAQNSIEVTVGMGGLIFRPDSITASAGDTINFVFNGGNHTVSQAAFDNPCNPLENGFNSGFTGSNSETFSIVVPNDSPIYFYCALGSHCQSGMVGAINPPSSGDTLDAFRTAASTAMTDDRPTEPYGGVVSVEGSPASTAPGAAQTSGGTTGGTTTRGGNMTETMPTMTETGTMTSASPTGNSAMALGGDVVKVVVGVLGAAALLL